MKVEFTGQKIFGSGRGDGIPQWEVTIVVNIPNFPIYQVTKRFTMRKEQVARIPVGTTIPVLAIPNEPQKIAIVWDPEVLKNLPQRPI